MGKKQETVGVRTKQAKAKERNINKEKEEGGYIKYSSSINIYISAASCLVTDTKTKVLKLGRT